MMDEQDGSVEEAKAAAMEVEDRTEIEEGAIVGEDVGDMQALDDLKLGAQLRIGTMMLPLRSILNMKVGEVLPLDRPLNAPVQVLAGGRTVATGELVASNGFYAVKIKEVSALARHLPVDAPTY